MILVGDQLDTQFLLNVNLNPLHV